MWSLSNAFSAGTGVLRIGYLVSRYPAQSHTFIEREIRGLTEGNVDIFRFSVRRSEEYDVLDATAKVEAIRTRWLVPPSLKELFRAVAWSALTRPKAMISVLADPVLKSKGRRKLKWLAYFGEGILLAWWLKQDRVQHLHCHFGNAGSNTAMIAARLAGLTFSITFHGIDLDEHDAFLHADKVRDGAFAVCISEHGRQTLLRNTSETYADKIHVVRCGCPQLPPQAIAPLPHCGRIVCVARLAPEKGHEILIEALHVLKQRGVTQFDCLFIGGGPLELEIKQHIKRLHLTDIVKLTGALPPAEVESYIARSDLIVLASWGEGIPIALMEAFAQRRPVVATRVGGVSELVSDGVNGRLVEPGDIKALADAIESMLSNYPRAAAMGEAGWVTLGEKHDPLESARRMKELFNATLHPSNLRNL